MGAGNFDAALKYLLDALSLSAAEEEGADAAGPGGEADRSSSSTRAWQQALGSPSRSYMDMDIGAVDPAVHVVEAGGGSGNAGSRGGADQQQQLGGGGGVLRETVARARIASLLSSRARALELPKYVLIG